MQRITERIRMANLMTTLCVLITVSGASGQVPTHAQRVEQWGIEEVSLQSGHAHTNPFSEVQLQAQFTSGARSVVVAGFYDGGHTWRIRFMPDQQGEWQFTTKSNDPELNDQLGNFIVVPPSSGNHGPVRVAKTFHFSYSDGKPYFLLGTTLYNWLNRDEALQNETLETLSKSPFTKVRFGLFPKWYEFNRVEPGMYPYMETSPQKFDLDQFNPEFFQHVERRLADLERLGIEADIILFHPYDHLGFSTMDADHDDAYIRYVAARLAAFRNVWWTMANEYDLFDPVMIPGQKVKDWDRMFQVLEKSDPYSHLRGIHNFATWYDHSKPWVTHVIIQDGMGHPARRLAEARIRYGKPTDVDEYGYEGNNGQDWGNLSAEEEVSRHWDITMSGGYASHGETYVHQGGILWWAVGGKLVGDSPARLGFLKAIMMDAPFQDLVPAPEIVQGGTALALKGEYYLVRVKSPYTRPDEATEVSLNEDGPYKVDLIDPWQMKTYELGYSRGGVQVFRTMVTPCLFRFTEATGVDQKIVSADVQSLLGKWIGDPRAEKPPAAVPLRQVAQHYSSEFTIGELLDDPRTRALVVEYLPTLPQKGFIRVFTLEQLSKYSSADYSPGNIFALGEALKKIPVHQE